MPNKTYVNSLIEGVNTALHVARVHSHNSYADVGTMTRLHPMCIISRDLKNLPYLNDVMQCSLNIVTAYYLQALPVIANIGGVDVKKVLNRLATTPGLEASDTTYGDMFYGLEAAGNRRDRRDSNKRRSKKKYSKKQKNKGPRYKKPSNKKTSTGTGSTSNNKKTNNASNNKKTYKATGSTSNVKSKRKSYKRKASNFYTASPKQSWEDKAKGYADVVKQVADGTDSGDMMRKHILEKGGGDVSGAAGKDFDYSNMAVGKIIDVDLSQGNTNIKIPVTLRLEASFASNDLARDLLCYETVDDTFRERWFRLKNGRISYSDFLFAGDIIKKKQKQMLSSKATYLEDVNDRFLANAVSRTVTTDFRLGSATNVAIVSSDVLKAAERVHRGSISNPKIKRLMMRDMGLMVLVVVDKDEEFVSFYYKGISHGTTVSLKSIMRQNKKDGPDIAETLKMFTMGSNVTI